MYMYELYCMLLVEYTQAIFRDYFNVCMLYEYKASCSVMEALAAPASINKFRL
jgi:hypothetical protein